MTEEEKGGGTTTPTAAGGGVGNPRDSKERETIVYQENFAYDSYRVIVQYKVSDNDDTKFISNQKCGMLIHEVVTNKLEVLEIRRLNRTKILVVCSSAKTANEIVRNEEMRKKYNPFIPLNYVSRVGILRDVDEDFDDNELIKSIDARQFSIRAVERLKRKVVNSSTNEVTYENSRSVKVTFDGQDIPSHVYLYYCKIECVPFVQRVVQCFQCAKFGHTSKYCKNTQNCNNCYMPILHDNNHICCSPDQVRCTNCKGEHRPTDNKCPEMTRQKKIKDLMSMRNLVFQEAAQMIPSINSSYQVRTQNRYAALTVAESVDFPALGNRNREARPNIEKFVPPPLPYVSNNNFTRQTKQYTREMRDNNKFSKRRIFSNSTNVINEAKKSKPSQESNSKVGAEQIGDVKNNFHPSTRNETANGGHDQVNVNITQEISQDSLINVHNNNNNNLNQMDTENEFNNYSEHNNVNTENTAFDNIYNKIGGVLSPDLSY